MPLTQQDLKSIQEVVKSELDLGLIPIKQELKEVKEDISALREIVQSLAVSVDKLIKATESLQQEYSLIASELKVHEMWIQQIAEKIGVQLKR